MGVMFMWLFPPFARFLGNFSFPSEKEAHILCLRDFFQLGNDLIPDFLKLASSEIRSWKQESFGSKF